MSKRDPLLLWNCYQSLDAELAAAVGTSSTAVAEILNPQARLPIPAGLANTLGVTYTAKFQGKFASNGAQNIVLQVGTPALAVSVWTSGNIILTTTQHVIGSPILVMGEINLSVRVTGTSATFEGNGWIASLGVAAFASQADPTTNGHNFVLIGPSPPAQGNAIDLSPSTSESLSVFMNYSTNSANNGWTTTQFQHWLS